MMINGGRPVYAEKISLFLGTHMERHPVFSNAMYIVVFSSKTKIAYCH